jgi:hypothetical protein
VRGRESPVSALTCGGEWAYTRPGGAIRAPTPPLLIPLPTSPRRHRAATREDSRVAGGLHGAVGAGGEGVPGAEAGAEAAPVKAADLHQLLLRGRGCSGPRAKDILETLSHPMSQCRRDASAAMLAAHALTQQQR